MLTDPQAITSTMLEAFRASVHLEKFYWEKAPSSSASPESLWSLQNGDFTIANSHYTNGMSINFSDPLNITPTLLFNLITFDPEDSSPSRLVSMFHSNVKDTLDEGYENLRTFWGGNINLYEDYLMYAMTYQLNWFALTKCSPLILQAHELFSLSSKGRTREHKDYKTALLGICQRTDSVDEVKELLSSSPSSWLKKAFPVK